MTIEKAFKQLLVKEPFYGFFCLGLQKRITTEVPTAGVGLDNLEVVLCVNPDAWNGWDDTKQIAILKHELLHICLGHLTGNLEETLSVRTEQERKLLNIAMDMEVNSNIPEFLTGKYDCCIASQIGEENHKGTLYYYRKLRRLCQSQNGSQTIEKLSEGQKDDHSNLNQGQVLTSAEVQVAQSHINAKMVDAAEQTTKSHGTIPSGLESLLKELMKPHKEVFNWKAYFRRLLGTMYDVNIKTTRCKPSKRFEMAAGIKHKKKSKILVAVDTSGSVSDEELGEFFSEIRYIYKAGANITIMEFDVKIQKTYEYSGKFTGKIHGRGGTDFNPPVNYYAKHLKEYSSMVMFSDGECPLPEKSPKGMVWIITSNGYRQNYPGKAVYIPKKEE